MYQNPFVVGQGYDRTKELHPLLGGGSPQSGIIFGDDLPAVAITTTPSGRRHGYLDGAKEGVLTYYGQGTKGHQRIESSGNSAVLNHAKHGKPLLWFRQDRKGAPYVYLGEFYCDGYFWDHEAVDSLGNTRSAIVFKIRPAQGALSDSGQTDEAEKPEVEPVIHETERRALLAVRSKQHVFRARLLFRERCCRITGISDPRFLRASHIKPWSKCESANERLDPDNGLLLSAHADQLFDRGWISFDQFGRLLVSSDLPQEIADLFGGALVNGRECGPFSPGQQKYLGHHREEEFEKAYKTGKAVEDVIVATD